MDVIWAFPVLLLGIALGTALAVGGLQIGPLSLSGGSIWIPILIIGFVYTPYMTRPIRGEVLGLSEKEFVEAAIAQGAGPCESCSSSCCRISLSTIIVFFTLNIANNMLLESALSFLGAGVQPPNASWGTMICDGSRTDLHLAAADDHARPDDPAHRLSLNVFGDGLRDAPDPNQRSARGAPGIVSPRGTPLMGRFIVRRLIGMLLCSSRSRCVVFLIFNVIPNSDPAQRIAGKNATPQLIASISEDWGFDNCCRSST